eukprot:gene19017-24837_t
MIILQDGRHLVGILRSFDHFINLILENALERVICEDKYCDIPLGLYIVRGDNIVLLGEIDDIKELSSKMQQISLEELSQLQEQVSSKLDWNIEA